MNQNNAAQPGLTDDDVEEIRHDWACFFSKSTEGGAPLCIRDIESRVRSKLRAEGVQAADERAAFEAWALTEFTHPFMVPDPLIEDPDGSGDYVNRDVQMAWAGYQQARAALASAPVAEDAKGQIEHLDLDNHRLRRALQKLMARLASLLDKDQFANCESIVTATGVEPPQSSTIVDELNSVKANAASVHPGFHGAPVAGEDDHDAK